MIEPMRPLTISELLDRTFSIYRNHWLTFVGIAAIPNSVLLGLNLVSTLVLFTDSTLALSTWFTGLSMLITLIVFVVASMLTQGATTIAVSQVQLGQPAGIGDAFASMRGRTTELIVLSLNVGVRVVFGLILLVIPGLYLALRYSLAMPVAVLEQPGSISKSIERSAELTQGHFGRILLIYVLLVVLTVAASAVWQLPVEWIVRQVRDTTDLVALTRWVTIFTAIGNFVVRSVVGPLMTIAFALIYYDERVRKEGFDLEHMLQQLEPSLTPPIA